MNPVKALRQSEAKLVKQLSEIEAELSNVRGALQMLRGGKSAGGKATGRKKRKPFSRATKLKMAASARKRWAAKKEQ
jgi:hypothetical protein